MRRINLKYREQRENRRLVKTKAHDPRWPSLGDYYIVDTSTDAIVARYVNFASFAERVAAIHRVR